MLKIGVVTLPSLMLTITAFFDLLHKLLFIPRGGVAVAVEGAAGHGNAAAHLGLHPVLVEFLEGEALVAVDGVDEPDVFFEEGGGYHGHVIGLLIGIF